MVGFLKFYAVEPFWQLEAYSIRLDAELIGRFPLLGSFRFPVEPFYVSASRIFYTTPNWCTIGVLCESGSLVHEE